VSSSIENQNYTQVLKGNFDFSNLWNVSSRLLSISPSEVLVDAYSPDIFVFSIPRLGVNGFAVGVFTNETAPKTQKDLEGTLSRVELFFNGSAYWYESWAVPVPNTTVNTLSAHLQQLSGDDSFSSSPDATGTDALQGMGGNDRFKGFYDDGPGYWHGDHRKGDFFYGGDGRDTSIYQGKISEYTITSSAASTDRVDIYDLRLDDGTRVPGFYVEDSVARRDGNDRLVEVERLEFEVAEENGANRIALDIDGNAGTAAKIVGVLRGKDDLSNLKLIGALIYNLDAGMSYEDLMGVALDALLGADKTNEAIAELVYTNLVGESPTLEVRRELASYMDSGAYSQAGFARAIADLELNATNIDLVGLTSTGLQYTEYVP
jgi:hypothetical protein